MPIRERIEGPNVDVLIWTDEVEEQAKQQLINTASMPFVAPHVAVMPDVHYGLGATIGSVVPTVGAIIPAAVGVDIGCGMCAVPTNLKASDLPESLAALRSDIEAVVPVGFGAHSDDKHLTDDEMFSLPSHGMNHVRERYGIQEPKQGIWGQLGTLGGGNHFIEVCLDEQDNVWVMLHSGSRGIGNRIGRQFITLAKEDMIQQGHSLPDKDLAYLTEDTQKFKDYLTAVTWAQDYAALNRRVMLRRILEVMKRHFPTMEVNIEERVINCHHNYISKEVHYGQELYITRKGAVRAQAGDMGIIPGSMGVQSYIVQGLGSEEAFHSCSHGAGRRMSRTKAKKAFTVEDHEKATEGVECRKDAGVLDETPGAYKDIDVVMDHQSDLVAPMATLKQILCVKG